MKPTQTERLLLAATEHIEALELEIEKIRADKLGLELKASIALRDVEKRVGVLERALERTNNHVQGLPQRQEFNDLRQQVSDISYNVPV